MGFMGAGKTVTGEKLAQALGFVFLDLDHALESMAGMTIRRVFEIHGEPWFRTRESELLKGTAALGNAVVSLGGGTFVSEENRMFVKQHGVSVYLDVPFEVLARRLEGKTVERPVFRSLEEARLLFEARVPCYKMADWVLPVAESESVTAVVERLADLLGTSRTPGGGGAKACAT